MARRRAHKEGTIFQDKNGIWWAQLPPDALGKRPKRRAVTQSQALQHLRELERAREQKIDITNSRQTVEQFLDVWLEEFQRPKLKPHTHNDYVWVCKRYIVPHLGMYKLCNLSPVHVQRWFNTLQRAGLGAETIKNVHRRLKTALGMALKARLVTENVAALVSPPTGERREIMPLTTEEAQSLLEAIRGHRLEALFFIAIMLGPRRGELIGFLWADLDWTRQELQITGQIQDVDGKAVRTSTKTRSSRRTLPLDDDLITLLRTHHDNQREEKRFVGADWKEHGLIFPSERGTPLGVRSLDHQFQRALKQAGIAHKRLHDLRHTAATLMLSAGVPITDVSKILGHSSSEVTARVYAHSYSEGRRQAVETVGRLLRKRVV